MTLIHKARASQQPRAHPKPSPRSLELLRWVFPTLLVLLWQLASSVGWLSSVILPAPSAVIKSGGELLSSGKLQEHLLISAGRALGGIALGGTLGFLLGLLCGAQRWADVLLDSTFQMIRSVPNLALISLVIMWFGIGEEGKLFLIALGTFFPVYLNTFHGVKSIDPRLLEMARIYGVGPLERFRRILLPGALPSVLVGLRFSLGIAWLSLVVVESFGARSGLGFLAMDAREFMQTDIVVLCIFIYALIGKGADSLVRLLERRWLTWHTGLQSR